MKDRILKHAELDEILDRLAQNPDSFEAECKAVARTLDAKGTDLEITNPESWHRETAAPRESHRISVEHQLRSEVDDILSLDRVAEAKLARRIEFARFRLNLAMEAAGVTQAELETCVHANPGAILGATRFTKLLPKKVLRRWSELHALRTEMVERNLYLVLINVERYAHTSASRLDLIQEGSAALFRAVDGFDWKRGLLFRTYAVHWLNQAFRSYLYNFGSTVRVPVYLQKAMKHVNLAKERLRDPLATPEAIAKESGLTVSIVEGALAAARSTRSIDAPLTESEDAGSLRDVLGEGEHDPYRPEFEEVSLVDGLHTALDRLSDRERYVVGLRFGLDNEREHTLAEVAAKLGVSLERVRQIQVRAVTKMRTPQLLKVIEPYLN